MGLDLGSKRIGVAVSDELGWTAQGVTVIKRDQSSSWLSQLDDLMDQYQVAKLVVGLPRNMDGSIGARGIDCQEIAEELKRRYQLPVELWDERLSTTAVERTLIAADVSRKKRKTVIDQMAASWILQGYLDAQGGK